MHLSAYFENAAVVWHETPPSDAENVKTVQIADKSALSV